MGVFCHRNLALVHQVGDGGVGHVEDGLGINAHGDRNDHERRENGEFAQRQILDRLQRGLH